jgi:uncharacterized protein (TIGR03437 family)
MNFLKAAPGQVISLMVYGLDGRLDHPMTATGTPLPLRLAGFSVSLQQDATTVPVPLLGISQQACAYPNAGAGLCESLTVISMQVPFELQTDCPLCGRPPNLNFFVVADAGVPKTMAAATVAGDNIHITDNCDTTAQFSQNSGTHLRQNRRARHGTRVDYNHRANVGEELVMYVFGLGQTNPLVKSGTATLSPPPQLQASQFGLNFIYTPNAAPSLPNLPGSPWFDYTPPSPVYVALVPGFVGLYQANFIVPPAPAVTPCLAAEVSAGTSWLLYLFTTNSFDGAGICVQTE